MLTVVRSAFALDARLEADSLPVMKLSLCTLRLMNDRRWPWLVLVPQRPGIEEMHELTPLDQAMLTFESNMVAEGLKKATGCRKINSGALGNIVRQLHFHIVARTEGDPNWPGPVWGFGPREPYRSEELHSLVDKIRTAL